MRSIWGRLTSFLHPSLLSIRGVAIISFVVIDVGLEDVLDDDLEVLDGVDGIVSVLSLFVVKASSGSVIVDVVVEASVEVLVVNSSPHPHQGLFGAV